ncbi:xanthine dehydrogenase family protein molybdopterin-binding subunit [Nisaea acidiphila]|uniref:Xanthine dehydrogenase family protein molybdopterin-binding subunit n=1 Tax=Nisaea acidiphila TaxID=1862145 RepID=A0A9J7ASP1_9PROT|nr:xanthine dehydrogenase family protein molybdopterin-binding subunit [Nisaea acidiphila]UUX49882.1 xanthine dehydrogenase family protein molybdopterin-binding subunit [Nisaea acidiphila]
MDSIVDENQLGMMKFGVGQPVPRSEDPKLLRGQGNYTDDTNLDGQAYAVMVTSPFAHGVLNGIETADALTASGVIAIFTGKDLEDAGLGTMKCGVPLKNRDGSPITYVPRAALATDKVRFVGDPVAIVIAETHSAAKDAAELVELDIDPLPAVTDARAAAAEDAPLIYDAVPGNVALDYQYGETAKIDAAFAEAAHVTKLSLRNNRIVVCAMEPRSAVGAFDPAKDTYELHVGCQGVFGMMNTLAKQIFDIPPEKMHVITGNVGGSFGMKAGAYPEYICVLHAAKVLGRPVKWTDERSGSFLSDCHGRDHDMTAELALDAERRFTALRITGYGNVGAYLSAVSPMMPTLNTLKNSNSVYRLPLIEVATKAVFTNTTPITAYRGAGRPEANYYMERLIETAARETGIDPIELRRRNQIQATEIPYAAANGMNYDSGDFPTILEKALEASDWDGYAARKAESEKKGMLRGRGVGCYLEVTAPVMQEMGGIRFEENGDVTIITGTLDYGQGHWTPFAQVLHAKLGVPFEKIKLIQGDSAELIAGGGTGGSKSIMASGGAIIEASDIVIEKGKQLAAHVFETAIEDIAFEAGTFQVAGTDRTIGIMELATEARTRSDLPADLPKDLSVSHIFENAPSAFPNGCHVCELEVDPETGTVRLDRYSMVNDFGTVVNPLLVEGQAHGGIVQGLGQALMESVLYDAEGQLQTGSYMDYALPRAADVPNFSFATHAVPATTNPLGAKGCGEAGCAGSLPSIMNALVDALAPLGVAHIDMPATPEKVWAAIQTANAT